MEDKNAIFESLSTDDVLAPDAAGNEQASAMAEDSEDSSLNSRTRNISELIIASFFICFSLVMVYVALTTKYRVNSRRSGIPTMGFPVALLVLILIFSTIQIFRSVRWLKQDAPKAKSSGEQIELFPGKSLVVFVSIIVYAIMWYYLRFTVSTLIVFLFVSKYLEPERKWRSVALVSFVFTAGLYVLFGIIFKISFHDPVASAVVDFISRSIGG